MHIHYVYNLQKKPNILAIEQIPVAEASELPPVAWNHVPRILADVDDDVIGEMTKERNTWLLDAKWMPNGR